LESSVAAKHGENGSSMAGFDIQNIGKQLAYIVRGERKFKNFKRNKTCAGVSATFFGKNVYTGFSNRSGSIFMESFSGEVERRIGFRREFAVSIFYRTKL
jgi:hypothetical protein